MAGGQILVQGSQQSNNTYNQQRLIAKIRAGIAAAANANNAMEAQPLLAPPTINTGPGNQVRANTTAYAISTVATNAAGTHQFIVLIAGTTAAAEPALITNPLVTTDPYNYGYVVDGGVSWAWLGPVRTTTAFPFAPLVSSGSLPAGLTSSRSFAPVTPGSVPYPYFRFTGGSGAFAGLTAPFTVYTRGPLTTAGGGPLIQFAGNYLKCGWDSAVEFYCDAPIIALNLQGGGTAGLTSSNFTSVEIDGRRLSDSTLITTSNLSAGNGYIILDFRANGGRKGRRFRLGTYNPPGTAGAIYATMVMTPQDTIWYPSNPNRYRVSYVGDSLVAGSASGPALPLWDVPSFFGQLVGCDDVYNVGVQGTGFIANASGLQLNYIQRISDIIGLNPDIHIIAGAINDISFTSSQRQVAMLAYLSALRQAMPNLMIIMAGTFGGVSPTNNTAIETDQQAAVNTFNDSNTFFMPVQLDTPAWFTGTGYLGGVTGVGNNDIYIGPSDNVHPSINGITYVAYKQATAFKNIINSFPV